MNQYSDWDQTVLKNEAALDNYLEYDDIEDLFNQTLSGIQDLDVPTGFVNELSNNNQTHFNSLSLSHGASNSMNFYHQKGHSRKISGTAIFGFDNHTRELSIDINDKDKSISPVQLLRTVQHSNSNSLSNSQQPSLNRPGSASITGSPSPKLTGIKEEPKKKTDYIVTNTNPKSYKFPPSPSPTPSNLPMRTGTPRVSYSAKYLQELGRINSNSKSPVYADDIEPLLEKPHSDYELKYVPIPINEPISNPQSRQSSPQQAQQIQRIQREGQRIQGQQKIQHNLQNFNTYLPPPSPPTLSHGSPEQSSPEPQSYNGDSPQHLTSSPGHEENLFYNPQFFSDDNQFFPSDYSSPSKSINSSPIKNYYSSPLRNINDYDETVDADNTIPQMTPLKPTQPITPSRNKVILEWSPIVSPNAKSNKDVKLAIRQSSAKKRIKKTSLLPPGELDKYWEGPNEEKFFICTYKDCGKKFTRRYNVRSHIQTHLSDRPFSCAYCPKKFVRQHDLNRHVKGHLESRPCECPCGKQFARVDAMRKHRIRNICEGGIQLNSNEVAQLPLGNVEYSSPIKYENNLLGHVGELGGF
ncbi:putative cell wall transcription factor Ace2p [[Candida] jaroonii]|uniref:Cell wall transcription factor Ace2p n=1 Tax=[Candida] jaroonii TaxID=467808 RepID=A0ACA9Y3M4_9ASCO|nr:putative cell wall transcription factor Ace2p [[Candida] jaroonii]